MWFGSGDLLRRNIGRKHLCEVPGERNARLAAATTTVPHSFVRSGHAREPREQLRWIARPEARVFVRHRGKEPGVGHARILTPVVPPYQARPTPRSRSRSRTG